MGDMLIVRLVVVYIVCHVIRIKKHLKFCIITIDQITWNSYINKSLHLVQKCARIFVHGQALVNCYWHEFLDLVFFFKATNGIVCVAHDVLPEHIVPTRQGSTLEKNPWGQLAPKF